MKLKIAWLLSLLLLLVTGVMGIYNGIAERSSGSTSLQKSVTAGVFLYGILGLIGAFGLFQRRRWSVPVSTLWGVVITYVAGFASIAYADDAQWSAALVAGAASTLIAAGVVWTARASSRD